MADSIRRIENEFDPNRCLARIANGQCQAIAVKGSEYCPMHGGGSILRKANEQTIRNYQLAKWSGRLNELADNPNVKSLRDEVAIARMTLEAIILKCRDHSDMLIFSSKISDMLSNINKLVVACNRLETQMAYSLDKGAAINLAEEIVNIIGAFLPDDKLDEVATQIGVAILKAGRLTLNNEDSK